MIQQAFCLSGTYREEDLGGGTVLSVEKNPLAFRPPRTILLLVNMGDLQYSKTPSSESNGLEL
jgi:hypothetical protein